MGEKMPWLKPGVEVVVSGRGSWTPEARVTTVERVNKVTFTIAGSAKRFRVVDGCSQETGWTHGSIVYPLDSDEGRRELEKVEHWKRRRRAQIGYERWSKQPSFAHRQALIAALNAITQDEEN